MSGFFAPHIVDSIEATGAVGGGLGIDSAVKVSVVAEVLPHRGIAVSNKINGEYVESCIAKYIAKRFAELLGVDGLSVEIEQEVSVPIGGGYGTSGASALGISLALSRALKIGISYLDIVEIAHEADIVCRTGLGTVVGIMKNCHGIVLVRRPGGPLYVDLGCIPLDSSIVALSAFYRPIPKSEILAKTPGLDKIREIGFKTLEAIEQDPTPQNFVNKCYEFATAANLVTPRVKEALDMLRGVRGLLGGSMNMIGEAVFALIDRDYAEEAVEVLAKSRPKWMYLWRPASNGVAVEDSQ